MTDTQAASPALSGLSGRLHRLHALVVKTFDDLRGDTAGPEPEAVVLLKADGLDVQVDDAVAGPFAPDEVLDALSEIDLRTVDLVLDPATGLDVTFDLPSAPLSELHAMIETEIDFRSPFSADQAISFWSGQETAEGGWRITACILIRAPLAPLLDAVAEDRITIGTVCRLAPSGSVSLKERPSWARAPAAGSRGGVFSRVPSVLYPPIIAGLALILSFGLLTISQSMTLSSLRNEAASLRSDVDLQSRAAESVASFEAARADGLTRTRLVADVTALLPDGVWLDQMTIKEDGLTIIGYGPSAADVTRLLSGHSALGEVRYGSPVVVDNTQNMERFHVVADFGEAS